MKEFYDKWIHQLFGDDPDPEGDSTKGSDQDNASESTKTFTQEEVDKLFNERFAREKAKLEKDAKDAAAAQLAAAQKEAEKKAKMDAEQRAQYEKEQLEARIQELEAAQTKASLTRIVANLLAENDIPANDDLIDVLTADDEDNTKARVAVFISSVQSEIERKEKARAKGNTPKGNGSSKSTDPFDAAFQKKMDKWKGHKK